MLLVKNVKNYIVITVNNTSKIYGFQGLYWLLDVYGFFDKREWQIADQTLEH